VLALIIKLLNEINQEQTGNHLQHTWEFLRTILIYQKVELWAGLLT